MFPTSKLKSLILTKKNISFFESDHSPYYIACPDYVQKSSGPRVLHYLCHTLNELGYEAYITANHTSPWLRTPKLTTEIRKSHELANRPPIIVYPEVVTGNPLKGHVVARWILNKAGHLGGTQKFCEEELLFYWDEWVLTNERHADRLYLDSVNSRIFNNKQTAEQRTGTCYYAHKYLHQGGKVHPWLLDNSTSLCQDIPRSPEEIAQILRTATLLFCYEPSNIVSEAYACGCPCVIVKSTYSEYFDLSNIGITQIDEKSIPSFVPAAVPAEFESQYTAHIEKAWPTIENFINRTQQAARSYLELSQQPNQKLKHAITLFGDNNLDQATKLFSELLFSLPNSPLPSAYLAFICAANHLTEDAAQFISKALEIDPARVELSAALGESFLKAGRPDLAVDYLQVAIGQQVNLFSAYPALAQSMHLTGKTDEAIALLQAVITMPEAASTHISSVLLELLAQQGNLDAFADICLRYSQGLADDLLAARCLARIDPDGERLLDALAAAQSRLPASPEGAPPPRSADGRCRIAFMLSDFSREAKQGRLALLLQHLPAERFVTQLIINDPAIVNNDFANACSLLVDDLAIINQQNDAVALEQLKQLAPDVLIDLDSYGAADRLSLLVQAAVPHKLLWGEVPLPPLTPDCLPLRGAKVADDDMLPGIALPGLGEYLDLPNIPVITPASTTTSNDQPRHFACLTPAIRIGRAGWQLFTAVLAANDESTLSINLDDLGECAQQYITRQFAKGGVAAERLHFVRIQGIDELCRFWQQVDIGLAPPVDDGDTALPSCLWMGKPYVALASALPWARRATTLLDCAGASEWIAETPEAFVERSYGPLPPPNPRFRENLAAAGLNDPVTFAQGFAASIAQLIQPAPHHP